MGTTTYEGANDLRPPVLSENPNFGMPDAGTIHEVPPLHILQTVIDERRRLEGATAPLSADEAGLLSSRGTLTEIHRRHEARELASAVARS
ncbi:MAG TPA: hypothetical protein VHB72_02765 [Candidatus Saccharimonadales bacterium]|nr:hypothetical protein [Candidatus Saccharimonadales bacterium]